MASFIIPGIPSSPILSSPEIGAQGQSAIPETVLYGIGTGGPVRVTSDGTPANGGNCLNLPTNTTIVGAIDLFATSGIPSAVQASAYGSIVFSASRGSGNLQVFVTASPAVSAYGELHSTNYLSSAGQSISVTADTTNQGINITFTPPAMYLLYQFNVVARARYFVVNSSGSLTPWWTENTFLAMSGKVPMQQPVSPSQNIVAQTIQAMNQNMLSLTTSGPF